MSKGRIGELALDCQGRLASNAGGEIAERLERGDTSPPFFIFLQMKSGEDWHCGKLSDSRAP
jgi:hypothetical protein